ncbi:MAG: N-acetyl-gamma-glutamyl-phosphate reductase [Pseudomonadota bacterium]
MIRALIFGATGYTGIELIRILSVHPEVRIVAGSSRQYAGRTASQAMGFVRKSQNFPLLVAEDLKRDPSADVAFLALPHGESMPLIRPLMDAGLKVIDLSADFRLRDARVYEQWYGPHKDPELLHRAVYGLPEIKREAVRGSRLVANPGCYPTSVILAVAPLLRRDDVDVSVLVADSKSGISGAGRGAKLNTSFCESGEGFKPYGVIGHRHIPEMEQELGELRHAEVKVRFTPHLIPVSRGMVSNVYLRAESGVTAARLREQYEDFYRDEPFVRVLPSGSFPDTAHVRGSNMCHVAVEVDERTGWIICMAAIDNLVKGASGAAVQNMNLIMGCDETAGLEMSAVFP